MVWFTVVGEELCLSKQLPFRLQPLQMRLACATGAEKGSGYADHPLI
jgi:hypothetical protein